MASAELPKSRFIHFPKTGGWWCCYAMIDAGIPIQQASTDIRGGHAGHYFGDPEKPLFGFVRHPYTWYQSLFQYLQDIDWVFHPLARSETLEEFVQKVRNYRTTLLPMSDWVDQLFGFGVASIGRYETLPADLVRILTELGEEFDVKKITAMSHTYINPSLVWEQRTPAAEQLIRETDNHIFDRFGYAP